MITDINNFLLSLASAIAAASGVAIPGGLSVHRKDEASSNAVYTVLRVYGGADNASFAGMRDERIAFQLDTRGTNDDAGVLTQARKLHATLLDSDGRPQISWSIPGKRLSAAGAIEVDPGGSWVAWVSRIEQVPGIIGTDEQGRSIATANYEIEFEYVPAA